MCSASLLHSIDCAGILKLRNADIELKKGETDIGRKNTRVRVVFRAAVPQPDGRMLWLQTTSVPVECCESAATFIHHFTSDYVIQSDVTVKSAVLCVQQRANRREIKGCFLQFETRL